MTQTTSLAAAQKRIIELEYELDALRDRMGAIANIPACALPTPVMTGEEWSKLRKLR
jgi:hypothetical protein